MAPAFIALTVIGISPCPEIKMMGIRIFALASSFWKSRPLTPGSRTSSTRQLATAGSLLFHSSAVDEKSSHLNPTDRKRLEARVANRLFIIDDNDGRLRPCVRLSMPASPGSRSLSRTGQETEEY